MAITGLSSWNNIVSVVFIVLSWGTVISGMIKSRNAHRLNTSNYLFVSLSSALIAMLFQTFDTARMVVFEDASTISDVVPYMTQFYLIFVVITMVLNYILMRAVKRNSKL